MAAGPEQGGWAEQAPIQVVVTGAAGNIGGYMAPLVASGEAFGDRDVNLRLLEIPAAMQVAEGVAEELKDGAYPYLAGVDIFDDPKKAFEGANRAVLIGSRPRGPGMERAELLEANGGIFKQQGDALHGATDDVRVLVVGNPANSNALVLAQYAPPELAPNGQITAMSRLDHNRALGHAAAALDVVPCEIEGLTIWGNHSDSMVVDLEVATVDGEPLAEALTAKGVDLEEYAQGVKKRGAAIIALRGSSSAMSAARAASDHMRTWEDGTPGLDSWTSAAMIGQGGEYDLPDDLCISLPVQSKDGQFTVVSGLKHVTAEGTVKDGIQATIEELRAERAALEAAELLPS